MHSMESHYLGKLRVSSTHADSGVEIFTDAPKDNQGEGKSFSPTDLLATSLASCMLTIMGITARTHQINIDGTIVKITKIMGTDPRRVIEVKLVFTFPEFVNYEEKQKDILIRAAINCPVAKSLHADLKQTTEFNF